MKRTFAALLLTTLALTGCSSIQDSLEKRRERQGYENPFYAQYLTNSALDRQIQQKMRALRTNPSSPVLHNELGSLLLQKGFYGDAETEFARAIDQDRRFFPAWYNLAVAREAGGNSSGAARALRRTLSIRPGHAQAHFLIGLMEERDGNLDEAVAHYARAFSVNHNLLDVRSNPRILDTKLVDRALLKLYPGQHARKAMQVQPAPPGYTQPAARQRQQGASPEATPAEIVTPSAPATDAGAQIPAPTTPAPPPPPE